MTATLFNETFTLWQLIRLLWPLIFCQCCRVVHEQLCSASAVMRGKVKESTSDLLRHPFVLK